ncbi:MAG: hypothetical protein RL133_1015 [Pseudomonadota bacterium]|jgi:UDP-3-O-[3-hydroxymyristoyl] glucosamine N-acyltransferase
MGQQPSNLLLSDVALALGARFEGTAEFVLRRFAPLVSAQEQDVAFVAHERYIPDLAASNAGAVVVRPEHAALAARFSARVLADNPYLFFAQAAGLLARHQRGQTGAATVIHPSAVIDSTAKIGESVRIGPGAVIEADAVIGAGVDLGPHVVVGEGARIGEDSQLGARVTVCAGVVIGQRAVIHPGAVLGSDGFGFAPTPERHWVKIPQTGGLVIGNDVEIGANTTIDRGALSDTRIGHGVKLDNQIQIAHNVIIGDHTAIAACVGIAGSARIGAYCQIGGAAGVLGHLEVADGTVIGPMSLVMSSITEPGKYVGFYPLQPEKEWQRSAARVRRLSKS